MGRQMRGNISDMLFISVIFLAFCITTVLAFTIWNAMTPPLTEALAKVNGGTLAAGSALAISQTTATLLMFDQLFAFMIIGTFIAIIISSFWLDSHPIFFVISLLTFIFTSVLFAILGNVYAEFAQTAGIQAAAAQYPLMYAFWGNVPTIALIFTVVLIIILYTKMRGKPSNAYSA
jgi:hypothetical protein